MVLQLASHAPWLEAPEHGEDFTSLLDAADHALYDVKLEGRRRYRIARTRRHAIWFLTRSDFVGTRAQAASWIFWSRAPRSCGTRSPKLCLPSPWRISKPETYRRVCSRSLLALVQMTTQ
jgi:hypothetical protein